MTEQQVALFRDPNRLPGTPAPLPQGPPWRRFGTQRPDKPPYVIRQEDVDIVNTALHLRRPLLVTGYPGVGKSSLAHALADDLGLGEVLHWPVNSRTQLADGLYRYDAVARLREAAAENAAAGTAVERYITLGPLGTALSAAAGKPRVLLVDELDKGDIDLPNDLLTVFEEGVFEIPELRRQADSGGTESVKVRLTRPAPRVTAAHTAEGTPQTGPAEDERAHVVDGWVRCEEFPVVVITSNGEREFPPAFLRRCVRLFLGDPDRKHLEKVVHAQFRTELDEADDTTIATVEDLIGQFSVAGRDGRLATDQLLNAIHLRLSNAALDPHVLEAVLRPLDEIDPVT
ncbi:AAA family ATPase [Streptomyces olivochromogenes]|uniref:AAA family ATPase n=1 Tax=Streptomyces olivochromogenes TaxID=1963 RepID=UPI0036DBF8EA